MIIKHLFPAICAIAHKIIHSCLE